MSDLPSPTHRFLLFMTIFMGVLIVAGFGFLAFEIANRAGDIAVDLVTEDTPDDAADDASYNARILPQAIMPEDVPTLPAGAVVQTVTADAGRLVIWYRTPEADDRIRVVDLATGGVLMEIATQAMTEAASPTGIDARPDALPGQIAPPLSQ